MKKILDALLCFCFMLFPSLALAKEETDLNDNTYNLTYRSFTVHIITSFQKSYKLSQTLKVEQSPAF